MVEALRRPHATLPELAGDSFRVSMALNGYPDRTGGGIVAGVLSAVADALENPPAETDSATAQIATQLVTPTGKTDGKRQAAIRSLRATADHLTDSNRQPTRHDLKIIQRVVGAANIVDHLNYQTVKAHIPSPSAVF